MLSINAYATMAPAKDKWVRRFIIPDIRRHNKGFTIYRITSVVFLKTSREEISKVSVWKRYNDFKKLHSQLSVLHARSQIKEPFPPFPKSRFFGRFEAEVIEERKEYALKFLDFIGRHSYLYSSDVFINFFESSHMDNCTTDCSQSMSSDTSEEDHLCNYENMSFNSNNASCINNSASSSMDQHEKTSRNVNRNQEVPIITTNEFTNEKKSIVESQSSKTQNANSSSMHLDSSIDNDSMQTSKNVKSKNSEKELSIHDGSDLIQTQEPSLQYILIAAAHMSAGFKHEAIAEYEEAFTQYKMGISSLLNGVQTDPDLTRANIVKEKISKYLERAERLYNRHLNCNISLLNKSVSELQNYKVLKVMKTVMLVKDIRLNCTRVIKTIEKLPGDQDNISNYILRGQVPYMTRLHACVETETTIFLVLSYASSGTLWDYVTSHYECCDCICIKDSLPSHGIVKNTSERVTNHVQSHKQETSNEINKSIDYSTTFKLNSESGSLECVKVPSEECLHDLPTTQLLEKAQRLLQSVNATLKKSNSVASRLNESKQLMYQEDADKHLTNRKNVDLCGEINMTIKDTRRAENIISNEFRIVVQNTKERNSSMDLSVLADDNENVLQCNINGSCTYNNFIEPLSENQSTTNRDANEDWKEASQETLKIYSSIKRDVSNKEVNDISCTNNLTEKFWKIPLDKVCLWAAEILLALEALHQQDVLVLDLNPDNILLDDTGHIQLTYIVPHRDTVLLKFKHPYSSPELSMFSPTVAITSATDIWSYGVIFYELLTGTRFKTRHVRSFHLHSMISIPSRVPKNARSLLLSILKYQPTERLTIAEIKQHSFFAEIDWSALMNPD